MDINPNDWAPLVTAIGMCVTAITGLIAAVGVFLSARRGQKQLAAQARIENKAETAIQQNTRIEDISKQLAQKTDQTMDKIDSVQETVNGPLGHALKATAAATSSLANITGNAADRKAANIAAILSDAHESQVADKPVEKQPEAGHG